jgi:diaminohydroxyphosphoribosylaminopyrimidine deaminase / 5-amino-6-(5-phosphoribosylamino)uracil reductase
VMGLRDIPADRRVLNDRAETVALRTRDPHEALAQLHARDRQHVFLEGGPHLAASFVQAGLVDEVVAYVAPALLGAGTNAVADLGIGSIADTKRLQITDVTTVGTGADANVRITMGFETLAGARASTTVERD